MTQLSHRQLLEFLHQHPHDDIADIGGDPTLEIDVPIARTIYNIVGGDHAIDICTTPLPRSHSTIISLDLFEHIVDPVRAADNIVASLTGWLFLTTVFVFHKHNYPIDMYRYTDTALAWLFRALECERCWMEPEPESPNGQRVSITGHKR